MGTLSGAINASVKLITVTGMAAPAPNALLKIDTELIAFRAVAQTDTAERSPIPGTWIVDRGQAETTAASHSDGATVTEYVPVFGATPFDQAGGGEFDIPGLPALATPDDADELPIVDVSAAVTKKVTVADLRAVPSTERELFNSAPTAVPGTGANTFLPWTKSGGVDLLDLTDPNNPTVIEAGDYAFTLVFNGPASFEVDPGDVGKPLWVALDADANGDDAYQDQLGFFPAIDASYVSPPQVSVSLVYYMPAGAVLQAAVRQATGNSYNFRLQGSMRRLS